MRARNYTESTAVADVLGNCYLTVREGNPNRGLVASSVGTAGDVNGYGYSDVLLNASGTKVPVDTSGPLW